MRYVIIVMACLLVACSGITPAPTRGCGSAYQCELQAYAKAGH